MSKLFEQLHQSSPLFVGNTNFLENLYEIFLKDPNSVDTTWRIFFQRAQKYSEVNNTFNKLPEYFLEYGDKQAAVQYLINAYRAYGHMIANLDPLQLHTQAVIQELEPGYYGFSVNDIDKSFYNSSFGYLSLRELIKKLRNIYTSSVGYEYNHLNNVEKQWIQERIENRNNQLNIQQKLELLEHLIAAEELERYLHTRYPGQKRFSLEGGDSLIPMLINIIQSIGNYGTKEVIMGMAHRGRLNVLVNVLGKAPADLFNEFEGKSHIGITGDVKYHLGFASLLQTRKGYLKLKLAFNPSHLEIVNPVVEGLVRASMEHLNNNSEKLNFNSVVPLLIHGDAAFSGQGVNMETLQLSQVRGYCTGGTIHIIVNNQIGFTTSNLTDIRSTIYCTDITKFLAIPIFHVNADDPESVLLISQLAVDYRMQFKKDVVIDLVCYRRFGHNEADEPLITQPVMYKKISEKHTITNLYINILLRENIITDAHLQVIRSKYHKSLTLGQSVAPHYIKSLAYQLPRDNNINIFPVTTAVDLEIIKDLSRRMLDIPKNFILHPLVAKIMDDRRNMILGKLPIDWGFAENIAYASIINDGYRVRISGQDCGRGTFFHRHAVLYNQENGDRYVPLQSILPEKFQFTVIDSPLSEEAVLGFEYGYASGNTDTLVIWEAQFGDFANGAQVVIDQFITSGQTKWGISCNLVMLLPHGLEGQGPEHSSARLERYLQLCADENIQVVVPSTPAQFFHILRRQIKLYFRKPLIIFSPKSLLRHRVAVSNLIDLTKNHFQEIIPEIDVHNHEAITRLVVCSGKIFYDLLEARRNRNLENVVIIRIEQLYPFPQDLYRAQVKQYPNIIHLIWCQEEPQNQGAWFIIQQYLWDNLPENVKLKYVGRQSAAAPAVGYYNSHIDQQLKIINDALTI